MLTAEQVFAGAKVMIDLSSDEEAGLLPFCEAAAAVINGKMKTGVNASDIRLITAASAAALCNYFTLNSLSEGDVSSFKAGDVTVSYSGSSRLQAMEKLKEAAFADASDLLGDDGFVFDCV